jgi:ABC-2 type transport system ATP-binding protein
MAGEAKGLEELSMAGVIAEGLRKRFGNVIAVDGIDFVVPPGTVGGLLGPNGAGKTTTIRMLTTLLPPDGGRATVAGYDIASETHQVRSVISLTGQYTAVDEDLTGRENLIMVGRLTRLGRRRARARADELLERFRLADAADRLVRNYSGGMRRRLDLAASVVVPPAVLFLDEPTTGLDPPARLEVWDLVRDLRGEGTTVVLTTQYLEEADRLADRISVVDAGRVIAEGTADELKTQVGGEVLTLRSTDLELASRAAKVIAVKLGVDSAKITSDTDRGELVVPIPTGSMTVFTAVRLLDAEGLEVDDVAVGRPSLDDVFLTLTGHTAQQAAAKADYSKRSPT